MSSTEVPAEGARACDEATMNSVHEDSPWAVILGPVYTAETLARELRLDKADVAVAVKQKRLLSVATSDGCEVFPSFQVSSHVVVAGVHEVLVALGPCDPLTCAQFLNTPAGVPPRRHIDRLAAGEVAEAIRDAERSAASWLS